MVLRLRLWEITLSASPGEFIGLFGQAVAATTFLLVAGGLLFHFGFVASTCGKNPYAMDSSARAAFRATNVGFLFQQFHLILYLDVLGNVLAPTLAR